MVVGDSYRPAFSCHGVGWISNEPNIRSLEDEGSAEANALSSFPQTVVGSDEVVAGYKVVLGLLVNGRPDDNLGRKIIGDPPFVKCSLEDSAPIKRLKKTRDPGGGSAQNIAWCWVYADYLDPWMAVDSSPAVQTAYQRYSLEN